MAVFSRKSVLFLPSGKPDWSDTQEQSMLFDYNQGIKLPPIQSIWWVVLLIRSGKFEYINSLSLRDTHRFKKQKYEISRTFAVKREKTPSVGYTPAHWLSKYRKKNAPKFQTKYGIELPTSFRIIELNQLKIWWNFKHINSLRKETHDTDIFEKNMSKIPVDNGSSLNSFQAMAPLTGHEKGVHFLRGHISLKNGTFCPLFSHDTSSFKDTCFLTRLKVLPDGLYGPHLHC
jgi:hypothetical protein